MYETFTIKEKMKLFSVILLPILITQLGLYAMNFFDTVMSGQAGTADLAGVAIGSSLWVPVFTGLNGILLAISPIVAHLNGKKQKEEIPFVVRQGIYLAILLAAVVGTIGYFLLDPLLQLMKLEPDVYGVAKGYLLALGIGLVPLFVYNLLRSFLDGLGHTRVSMFITLIALPINVFLNYIFIFGKLGLPALGGIGAGLASSITYWLVMVLAIFIIHRIRPFAFYHIFNSFELPNIKLWLEQLKIGIPIGFAIFFETSIFAAVTLFMSDFGTNTIAAHQAAINFSSFLYMIPLSISMALTVVVGFEVGAMRVKDAITYSKIGILGAILMAVFCGIILYVFDDWIAQLYNSNPKVIKLTKHFIFYAIFFQLSDAFGAPIQGVLRGYKDVNITLIMALVSYWVIGLPSGILLATYTDFGPYGYWMGLIIGLAAGAMTLLGRMLVIQKKHLAIILRKESIEP
ncbi:MATE family efflux transporter [Bacillaceae bacterium S4-13-56]